jgi:glutathione S-transferase
MKLIGPRYSAFVARVRIALALKQLVYDEAALPAGGLHGEAFQALNPLGRVPVLVLDDGAAVPESETILAFLDETYPEPALLPADRLARVKARTIVRLADNYLAPAIECLYPFRNEDRPDPILLGYALADLKAQLSLFGPFVDAGRFPILGAVSVADCVLFPTLYLVKLLTTQLGVESAFAATGGLGRYFAAAKADPLFGAIYAESVADLGDPDLRTKLALTLPEPGGSSRRQATPSTERSMWTGQAGHP